MSPNALRLLGRLHRYERVVSPAMLAYESRKQFDAEDPRDTAAELVFLNYLREIDGGWMRTTKPYTQQMKRKLAALAQRRSKLVLEIQVSMPMNNVDPTMDPAIADWFGYPRTPVYLTGRVHLLEEQ